MHWILFLLANSYDGLLWAWSSQSYQVGWSLWSLNALLTLLRDQRVLGMHMPGQMENSWSKMENSSLQIFFPAFFLPMNVSEWRYSSPFMKILNSSFCFYPHHLYCFLSKARYFYGRQNIFSTRSKINAPSSFFPDTKHQTVCCSLFSSCVPNRLAIFLHFIALNLVGRMLSA